MDLSRNDNSNAAVLTPIKNSFVFWVGESLRAAFYVTILFQVPSVTNLLFRIIRALASLYKN